MTQNEKDITHRLKHLCGDNLDYLKNLQSGHETSILSFSMGKII